MIGRAQRFQSQLERLLPGADNQHADAFKAFNRVYEWKPTGANGKLKPVMRELSNAAKSKRLLPWIVPLWNCSPDSTTCPEDDKDLVKLDKNDVLHSDTTFGGEVVTPQEAEAAKKNYNVPKSNFQTPLIDAAWPLGDFAWGDPGGWLGNLLQAFADNFTAQENIDTLVRTNY